jgi:hypothetical protein
VEPKTYQVLQSGVWSLEHWHCKKIEYERYNSDIQDEGNEGNLSASSKVGIYDNYKKKTRNSSGQFRIIMLAYIIIERIAL